MNFLGSDFENEKGLMALLDLMIPADPIRGLPSGSCVGFQPSPLAWENLKILDEASMQKHEKTFASIIRPQQIELIKSLKRPQQTSFSRLARLLAECYYSQPEVARIIGAGEEPPFPEGYRVEEGDLSLLEPVYLRGRIYRDV